MEPLMSISAIVSAANMVLLGILACVFARMYSRSKAQLPIGMILFTAFLFVHNSIGVYGYFAMEDLYSQQILPVLLLIHLAELGGIITLLKITMQ